ncbi:methylated-DNA--[protein]-cysteine S-methyltransferase [Arthrobacter sp. MYb222]|uniref:methylated-DNA--[protein]-cysteine S-methyltransferase n=1 Tax=Arthrobacter sp. MYb222 TaxID=1848599 RepID=UPI000CFDF313|nr:methylated-DNA--[protein]-cysteine S-methyltransferase [Arthrobacter sp. MYb222]PQZ86867.1 cysteine methyltransferase [Arthrobacter sp. MYb222]
MNGKNYRQQATAAEAQILDSLQGRLVERARALELVDVAYRVVDSPVGALLLASTDAGLVRVAFESEGHDRILEVLSERVSPRILRDKSSLDGAVRQLDEYFAGQRHGFDLPVDLQLSTEFRRQVQLELGHIDYGRTLSYAQLAQQIGKPKAVRAVGSACATNPIPIVLPCHRVLRTDGSLGGYLGGLEAKSELLKLENPDFASGAARLF